MMPDSWYIIYTSHMCHM